MPARCAAAVLLAACSGAPPAPVAVAASGSVALSGDGALAYVTDADGDALEVVELATGRVTATLSIPGGPDGALVGPDETLYVTSRRGRTVSAFARGAWSHPARTATTCAEPSGLALVGTRLAVACFTAGRVAGLDAATFAPLWSSAVGRDPRALIALPDGRLVVGLFRSATLVLLESAGGQIVGEAPLVAADASGAAAFSPGLLGGLVSARGRLIGLQLAGETSGFPVTPTGAYAGGGQSTPIAVPSLATAGPDLAPRNGGPGELTTLLTPQGRAMSGASALAVDRQEARLFVAFEHSGNLGVIALGGVGDPAAGAPVQSTPQLVDVGAGPRGIAVSANGRAVYVHAALDRVLVEVALEDAGPRVVRRIPLGPSPLPPSVERGRRLFMSASDPRMTDPSLGGISCASCHPDGRDDGRTWTLPEGRRNTPSLAGRKLRATAPWHWDGALTSIHGFDAVVQGRMGGAGVGDDDLDAMFDYLDALPPADNPHLGAGVSDAERAAQQRGAAVFAHANCAGCHAGAALTDNAFHDVGTLSAGERPHFSAGVNTPSLLSVFDTAPFLHDGSAPTLAAHLARGHGGSDALDAAARADLAAYLLSL